MDVSDLYQLGRRLTDLATQGMAAAEPDLSPSEFMVLRDLVRNGRSSISDAMARTGLAQSRVSTSVKTLAGRGWLVTHSDPTDGRRTLAEVRPDAPLEARRRRDGDVIDAVDLVVAGCSRNERAELADALQKLHRFLITNRDQDAAAG